ncbi:DUF551 domain-containing protein [Enterobacter hormaechei]|uniref:DUF551 domain-containing protein n=1 Tax=Enterobacter hormaechei TaxID=158836 RepID=UPI000F81836C|nr:DUF551 domain-containing protein [Enterobacter hormaechei]RTM81488.1 DUF551 domain-containing protein [Enterobacter hormaechei subsp. xiangfangensis]
MITLTKEWLQQTIAELEEERDATPGAVNEDAAMALAAMKLALASLEAEPAISINIKDGWPEPNSATPVVGVERLSDGVHELYTAPPAQTAPDKITSANAPEVFEIAAEAERLGLRGAYASYAVGWNACRAAMLQGAEPVKTANKLPEPIKDNRLNSGAEADDYYSGYQAGWNECLESVQVICEGNPDAK